MENSRKPAESDSRGQLTPAAQTFAEAVAAECARRLSFLRDGGLAVACSGGRDSSALLHALAAISAQRQIRLICLHVDHGLQAASAAWVEQVRAQAEALGVDFDSARIELGSTKGQGVEATARARRYAALQAMCRRHSIGTLALGHHALDQAETLLMRLLRGSGPHGLAAMRAWDAGRADRPAHWRPMLDCQPDAIAGYVAAHRIAHVDDPTNAGDDYLRNALRHRVLAPLLDIAPQALTTMGRSARLLRLADDSLRVVAAADLAACRTERQSIDAELALPGDGALSLTALAALDDFRRGAVLQLWIEASGAPAPPEAWIAEAWAQIATARADANIDLRWQDRQLLRHRGRIECVREFNVPDDDPSFSWDGQLEWQVPDWRGAFLFEPAAKGIAGSRLRSAPLIAAARSGGEHLRIDARRPSRSLRHWYQSLGIAPWQRRRAPLLWLGADLLHVPGIGSACEFTGADVDAWQIRWRSDD